jgi:hypothetical protein
LGINISNYANILDKVNIARRLLYT